MDNKKLFKFLYKDIAEIEELFDEKGADGFDKMEMEFLRTRFNGAKHIIRLLSEESEEVQPDVQDKKMVAAKKEPEQAERRAAEPGRISIEKPLSKDEQESLESLQDFEEELKDNETLNENSTEEEKPEQDLEEEDQLAEEEETVEEENKAEMLPESKESGEGEDLAEDNKDEALPKEPREEQEDVKQEPETNVRIGDRQLKEKSVNDLLGGKDLNKLEYKISNSPVKSLQAAIGINDRYQYIRELFDGSADSFSTAVGELDNLNNINEAVAYLQQNFKWKKTETSLKFVNLVKRRFPNG
ncbi:hypothetical protein [uncultured Draconibacterium sp.]|uniref:hypothetical protein n=1 Tax=uncultured Draconibacterium sp. TaxID=1573823 RepID=UPI00325FEC4B